MDQESLHNLEDDFPLAIDFVTANGGRCTADPDQPGVYWLVLHPRRKPDEAYYARVAWSRYPYQPPSVKFALAIGGDTTMVNAWPVIAGYAAGSYICKPFTAEGYAAHPEWAAQHPWVKDGNPFLYVAETLQADFDERYQGRAG